MAIITPSLALALAQQTIDQEISALQALSSALGTELAEPFPQCARLLAECPGLIWTTGVGTSANMAARLAHLLTDCGVRAMFLAPGDGLHGHAGVISPGDVMIALSRGGGSREVNQMVEIAGQRGATTLAMVHDTDSSLARLCHYVLPVRSPAEAELLGFVATTSTVAFAAMGDALCAVVAQAKGYSPAEFAKIHPGGAVGQRLNEG
jgi:D-arabinose 5-phosphate isomerase GutQ